MAAAPALWALAQRRPWIVPRSSAPDLLELARIFRESPRAEVFDRAASAIRSGADAAAVFGATFLAGIHDVRPRHVGGKLHCVLMVESACELAAEGDAKSAWHLALWSLDDFKRSQELDRSEGDWELGPRPEVTHTSEASARHEFLAAMDAWDDERADRAIVGLLSHHGHKSMFEILWPLAGRSYVNIGHKIIFASQCERMLRRIGWSHAEPVLRSLVYGLLYEGSGRQIDAYEHARELSSALPEQWLAGREEPAQSLALEKELRERDVEGAQRGVVAAFRDGLGPNTVWDALRLWASELFLARSKSRPARDTAALLPVHAVTVAHAFGHASRTSASDATRRLLVLQAAGWLAAMREALRSDASLRRHSPPIESAAACVLATPELVRQLARKAEEHHQHKYAAAMLEESRLVHPRWAPALLACSVPYLPAADDAEPELAQRADHALSKAGVG